MRQESFLITVPLSSLPTRDKDLAKGSLLSQERPLAGPS